MARKILTKQIRMNRGYTIIETMISVALFLIIITSGMSALLNVHLLHNKSQDMRFIIDNLNFVMEDMSRNMRIGYNYRCFAVGESIIENNINVPRRCASGYGIAFESPGGSPASASDQQIYYIDSNGVLHKSSTGINNYRKMTPPEVELVVFEGFSVLGAESLDSGDKQQPLVIIRLVGNIEHRNINTPFSLQTAVSQRLIDI